MHKALIVEDERNIAEGLRFIVNQMCEGWSASDVAHDARAALESMRLLPVDLILTDIKMPGINGLEMIETIHHLYPHILTVIISGYADFEYARTALHYSVVDYILKPVSPEKLKAVLRKAEELIEGRKLRNQLPEHRQRTCARFERALQHALAESSRAEKQKAGEAVLWATVIGPFWGPRSLLGIENHLYAFYDEPELMDRINRDLADYNLRAMDELCRYSVPDFMTVAEDMSYNHGPMLSGALFERFLAPFYKRMLPEWKARGIRVFCDSDGDVTELIPWLKASGFDGILPLERQAGVDVAKLREAHPDFLFLGHFDKTVMKHGEAAMRSEFERLLPVMQAGGFIASVDHQTPPDVSLETYRMYLKLYREYAEKGASL